MTADDVTLTDAEPDFILTSPEGESVAYVRADRLTAVQAEADRATEALDNYLSDPPLPIGNDVIAEAQELYGHARADLHRATEEIERLTVQLAEATEATESAEAELDDARRRLAEVEAQAVSALIATGRHTVDTARAALANPPAEPNGYRVSLDLTSGDIDVTPAHLPAQRDAEVGARALREATCPHYGGPLDRCSICTGIDS